MDVYKDWLRRVLSEYAAKIRKNRRLTQAEMAEELRISICSYGHLERGEFCFSGHSVVFFLLLLNDDEVKEFIDILRREAWILEFGEAA